MVCAVVSQHIDKCEEFEEFRKLLRGILLLPILPTSPERLYERIMKYASMCPDLLPPTDIEQFEQFDRVLRTSLEIAGASHQ
jgi:hypothetical protein